MILKNIMKKVLCVVKDNGIKIDIECMNGRGKRELIKIPSVWYLLYDRFKHSILKVNFILQILEVLSSNVEETLSSSLIRLFHYVAEHSDDRFISVAGDSSLMFSGHILYIEIVNMSSDIGINVS